MSVEKDNPYADRAASLKGKKAELIADVRLYSTAEGGKQYPAFPGWGCPCLIRTEQPIVGFDGWHLLDESILPGKERKGVGFVFLSPQAASKLTRAGKFYLWEGKLVGEARVIG